MKNNKKDNEDASNYRPVIISVLAKLFTICLRTKPVGHWGITGMLYSFKKDGVC